ncbi:hypothetical protein A2U01_0037458 [Trifolium medium]|uniref:Uncharacterized protein n=1 Tax=Trifolium medium TaxID=97028 RepID=A0A392PYB7_9FABA|nr:hypothetical protein [Trifolium medium]
MQLDLHHQSANPLLTQKWKSFALPPRFTARSSQICALHREYILNTPTAATALNRDNVGGMQKYGKMMKVQSEEDERNDG